MCLKMLLERSQGFRIKPRAIMTRNWAELWLEWEAIGFKVRFLGPSPGKDQHFNMEGASKSCTVKSFWPPWKGTLGKWLRESLGEAQEGPRQFIYSREPPPPSSTGAKKCCEPLHEEHLIVGILSLSAFQLEAILVSGKLKHDTSRAFLKPISPRLLWTHCN